MCFLSIHKILARQAFHRTSRLRSTLALMRPAVGRVASFPESAVVLDLLHDVGEMLLLSDLSVQRKVMCWKYKMLNHRFDFRDVRSSVDRVRRALTCGVYALRSPAIRVLCCVDFRGLSPPVTPVLRCDFPRAFDRRQRTLTSSLVRPESHEVLELIAVCKDDFLLAISCVLMTTTMVP